MSPFKPQIWGGHAVFAMCSCCMDKNEALWLFTEWSCWLFEEIIFCVLMPQERADISTGLNHSHQQWLLSALLELCSSYWKIQSSCIISFLLHFLQGSPCSRSGGRFPHRSLIEVIVESVILFSPSVSPLLSVGCCVHQSKFIIVMHIRSILYFFILCMYFLKSR